MDMKCTETGKMHEHFVGEVCEKCNILAARLQCKLCTKQQIFNITFSCFAIGTIVVNAILIGNLVTKNDHIQILQQDIESLQLQLMALQESRLNMGKQSYDNDNLNEKFQPIVHTRMKRNANPKLKKKKEFNVHVAGLGGQHMPEGVFQNWLLANWTKPKGRRRTVFTKSKEFHMDMNTGELTISRKGVYVFYSQITLMGRPNQGYYVERKRKGRNQEWEKLASCFLAIESATNVNQQNHDKNFSCPTMRLVEFHFKDKLRIRHEKRTNILANFDPWASYFGLFKIK